MKLSFLFKLNFGDKTDIYYKVLKEEDFDFKTKNIKINISKENNDIVINCIVDNFIEFKIASNAVMNSIEIINKTINI
jgi:hypothetical protein